MCDGIADFMPGTNESKESATGGYNRTTSTPRDTPTTVTGTHNSTVTSSPKECSSGPTCSGKYTLQTLN